MSLWDPTFDERMLDLADDKAFADAVAAEAMALKAQTAAQRACRKLCSKYHRSLEASVRATVAAVAWAKWAESEAPEPRSRREVKP